MISAGFPNSMSIAAFALEHSFNERWYLKYFEGSRLILIMIIVFFALLFWTEQFEEIMKPK